MNADAEVRALRGQGNTPLPVYCGMLVLVLVLGGLAACGPSVLEPGTTGVHLVVTYKGGPFDQLHFFAISDEGEAALAPRSVPEVPRPLSAEGETLAILVDDALAGTTLQLHVDASHRGLHVGSGASPTRLRLQEMVEVRLPLHPQGALMVDDPDAPLTDSGTLHTRDDGVCGDGVLDVGESCDLGSATYAFPGGCDASCQQVPCAADCEDDCEDCGQCSAGESCAYRCESDCAAEVDGNGADATLVCSGPWTTCTLDCNSIHGGSCRMLCLDGARCRYRCHSFNGGLCSCTYDGASGAECVEIECNSGPECEVTDLSAPP